MSDQLTAFDLVFEGPVDDKPETLRRLKAAFLVDLNFPMERVQEIMTQTPAVIFSSDSEMELTGYIDSLKQAGARVLLVRNGESQVDVDSSNELEFDLDLDIGDSAEHILESDEDAPLFHFDENNQLIPPAPKEPKTYELPETLDDSDDAPIIPAILTKQVVTPVIPSPPIQTEEVDLTLAPEFQESSTELTLGDPIEENELVESAVANQFLLDDGENYSEKLSEAMDEVIEEHASTVPEEITAVGMVLQNLNTTLQLEGEDEAPVEQVVVHGVPHSSATTTQLEEHDPGGEAVTSRVEKEKHAAAPSEDTPLIREPLANPKLLKAVERTPSASTVPLQKRRFSISLSDVLIPLLIGIPMVVAGNWLYFQPQQQTVVQYDEVAKALSSVPKPQVEKPSKAEVKSTSKQTFIGRQSYSNRSIDADIAVNNELKKVTIELKIETPEPPPLTAEQIGRREVKAPWIRKIELDRVKLDLLENGTFSSAPVARIYVENEGVTTRLIGASTVTGTIDPSKGTVEVTTQVLHGRKAGTEEALIRKIESGKFEIVVSGSVTARQVTEME